MNQEQKAQAVVDRILVGAGCPRRIEHRDLLMAFLGSLSFAENMGDVVDDTFLVLDRLGIEVPDGTSWHELPRLLHEAGVEETLQGTPLVFDEEDEND